MSFFKWDIPAVDKPYVQPSVVSVATEVKSFDNVTTFERHGKQIPSVQLTVYEVKDEHQAKLTIRHPGMQIMYSHTKFVTLISPVPKINGDKTLRFLKSVPTDNNNKVAYNPRNKVINIQMSQLNHLPLQTKTVVEAFYYVDEIYSGYCLRL